jgi:hypothetical protein
VALVVLGQGKHEVLARGAGADQDLYVWEQAQEVYVANPSAGVIDELARRGIPVARVFKGQARAMV